MKNWLTSCTRRNNAIIFSITAALLLLFVLLSLCLGAVSLSVSDVWEALFCRDDTALASRILWYSRVPRLIAALLVGGCLSLAGCLVQTATANPLASPGIMGINAGAGFFITLLSVLFPSLALWQPAAAFLGAFCTALTVTLLGEAAGGSRITLVLCGVMMTALLSALTDMLLNFHPAALSGYTDFRMGSLTGVTLNRVLPLLIPFGIIFALCLTLSERMEVLNLGAENAAHLGLNTRLTRFLLLIFVSILCGIAVSLGGVIGFIGLIVPHISIRLIRGGMRIRLVFTVLTGALLCCICDLLSRTLFGANELPVGILLSLVGVPFFMGLLIRQRKGDQHA